MQYGQMADLANEIHQRYQEEAAQRRLAAQCPPAESRTAHLLCALRGWLGWQLIKWGEKVQGPPVPAMMQLAADGQRISKS
jgi:hypothetical protein